MAGKEGSVGRLGVLIGSRGGMPGMATGACAWAEVLSGSTGILENAAALAIGNAADAAQTASEWMRFI